MGAAAEPVAVAAAPPGAPGSSVDLEALFAASGAGEVLEELDRELVGLAAVKARVREIAALLVVDRARATLGVAGGPPTLHMSFTGNPGTGKTTVALRMARILHRLGFLAKGQLVPVTRDDLVGQYVGHTAPKTKEAVRRALGGVLFVDEAYHLHRPENERDYGAEAIEILLQEMEARRGEFVVVLAGYPDRMERFFRSNPGLRSRIAHHLEFPDYAPDELLVIAERMLRELHLRLSPAGHEALREYVARRRARPLFANARSIRNALDRARLRQAARLFAARATPASAEALVTLEAEDLRRSRVFEDATGDPRGGAP